MTETQVLSWIKCNLGPIIQKAILSRPNSVYTEEWLAAIACRETGDLIARYAYSPAGNNIGPTTVCSLLRGDFSQRPGETEKQYHGYGITQIDIKSFPDFVKSGDWKDPFKCFTKTIDILNSDKTYLLSKTPSLAGDSLNHYITAAYNCGAGNEDKIIHQHLDPDAYTTGHNYATQVFQFAEIYKNIV